MVLLFALGWQVIAANLPIALARAGAGAQAAAWFPSSAAAHRAWAAEARDAGQVGAMEQAARRALALAPIDQRSVTLLAITTPGERQRRLIGQSAALGWRDPFTQLILTQAAAMGGDADLFAQRFDAMARQAVSVEGFAPFLDKQIARPAFRSALADRLALRPIWRPFFLGAPLNTDAAADNRAALLDELAARRAPPTADELRGLVAQLRSTGRQALARALWVRFAAVPGAFAGELYDGGFAHISEAESALPYQWTAPADAGGYAGLEVLDGRPVLHAHQSVSGVAPLLAQTLALAPGRHRLSVEVVRDESRPSASHAGFGWEVRCASGATLARSTRPPTQAGSGRFVVEWTVPASGCGEQVIELAGTSLEGEGDLFLSSARIDRLG